MKIDLAARLETPIEEINAQNFMCLLVEMIEQENTSRHVSDKEITAFYTAVNAAAVCEDHGFPHNLNVFNRALECLEKCPNLSRLMQSRDNREKTTYELAWASTLHDFYRFLGADFASHQRLGAELAKRLFKKRHPIEADNIFSMLVCHDYLCPLVNGQLPLPSVFLGNPLPEIFRLADKTSVSPAEEIHRYYLTGKRLNAVFYNPQITFDQRIDFKWSLKQNEHLAFFLVFFAIQPTDFFFTETSELYRQWAQGKQEAAYKIIELGSQEGLGRDDLLAIKEIISRFHHEVLQIASPFD